MGIKRFSRWSNRPFKILRRQRLYKKFQLCCSTWKLFEYNFLTTPLFPIFRKSATWERVFENNWKILCWPFPHTSSVLNVNVSFLSLTRGCISGYNRWDSSAIPGSLYHSVHIKQLDLYKGWSCCWRKIARSKSTHWRNDRIA